MAHKANLQKTQFHWLLYLIIWIEIEIQLSNILNHCPLTLHPNFKLTTPLRPSGAGMHKVPAVHFVTHLVLIVSEELIKR